METHCISEHGSVQYDAAQREVGFVNSATVQPGVPFITGSVFRKISHSVIIGSFVSWAFLYLIFIYFYNVGNGKRIIRPVRCAFTAGEGVVVARDI